MSKSLSSGIVSVVNSLVEEIFAPSRSSLRKTLLVVDRSAIKVSTVLLRIYVPFEWCGSESSLGGCTWFVVVENISWLLRWDEWLIRGWHHRRSLEVAFLNELVSLNSETLIEQIDQVRLRDEAWSCEHSIHVHEQIKVLIRLSDLQIVLNEVDECSFRDSEGSARNIRLHEEHTENRI